MSSLQSLSPQKATVVERPRAGDALGMALRDAYERDFGLPADMEALLRDLNDKSGGRATTVKR